MIITDPQVIREHLTPPDVRTIPFGEYSSRKKALVDATRKAFENGEGRLEELLEAGRLDEEKKEQVFAEIEGHILRLRIFKLEGIAYAFAMRYARIQQQYIIH